MTLRRILSGIVMAMLIAVGVSVGLAGAASAHDVLISSSPADNATVATAPASISFTFDQPVQNFDPVVSLVGPDGKQLATGTPVVSGNVVTGTVGAGPAGKYTAAYRIVSADGHPVTGQIHFTLAGDSDVPGSASGSPDAAAGSPAAPSAVGAAPSPSVAGSATAAPAPPAAGSSGLSAGLWIGLAIAAVVIAAAAILLLRRPRRSGSPDRDY